MEQSYLVRFNGETIIETSSKGVAEEEFHRLISLHPECECAILCGEDEDGDEIKLEAYSGYPAPAGCL